MSCMKCGRDTEGNQSFCGECLAEMEKYPVKPDAVVLLPDHRKGMAAKKTHQRRQTPEEQIAALEKKCRRLASWLTVLVVLLVLLAVCAVIAVKEMDVNRFIGQNYKSATTPIATTSSFDQ